MSEPIYRFGGWTLDVAVQMVQTPSGAAVSLPPKEADLLRIFLDHPQQRLTRQYLVDAVFGANPPKERDLEFSGLSVLVCRLRKRLQDRTAAAPLVQTVRNGYWFCVAPEIVFRSPQFGPIYRFDGWTMDYGRRALLNPTGEPVSLGSMERRLLRILLDHPQTVLLWPILSEALFTNPPNNTDKRLTLCVHRLRAKIEANIADPQIIKTVRGGYRFCPKPEIVSEAAM